MARDVFISYSSADKSKADAVCRSLEAAGIRCWIAPRDIEPGMEWADAIVAALDSTQITLLVFSSRSNASKQVGREISLTFEKSTRVFPVRIENVQPKGQLEFFLKNVHWLDAFSLPFEKYQDQLVRTTFILLGRKPPTQVEVKSVPPLKNDRLLCPRTKPIPELLQKKETPSRLINLRNLILTLPILILALFIIMMMKFHPWDDDSAKLNAANVMIKIKQGELVDIYRSKDYETDGSIIGKDVDKQMEINTKIGDKFWIYIRKRNIKVAEKLFDIQRTHDEWTPDFKEADPNEMEH